jgi:methionine synthase II (cobalamin-independent)
MTGRAIAMVADLGFDLQPAGWRLTDRPGIDHRRARSLLAQDLDALEEQAQGVGGTFKIQVAGPWTLAASVEKPRGDKVLSDHGARRELSQALAEGVAVHLADVRRRVAADRVVVQLDEPALPAVLAGQIPTASGFGRHRVVHPPEASAALEWVLAAAGDDPWVHSCAAGVPWGLLRGAGARGLSADLAVLTADDMDALAEALEAGETLALGVVPSLEPATEPDAKSLTESVLRWLDMLGLDPETVTERLVITPSCGLAGASPAWARRATGLCGEIAANLSG